MKYTIETTKNGCVETITLDNGIKYSKNHIKTGYGSIKEDNTFSEQMERDGICEGILERVYDLFDGFIASEFMNIADLYN